MPAGHVERDDEVWVLGALAAVGPEGSSEERRQRLRDIGFKRVRFAGAGFEQANPISLI